MAEALPSILAFGYLIVSYLLAGAIDARLQLRHPEDFERLGNLIDTRGLNRDTLPHMGRWLKFLTWENFSRGDLLLSFFCVLTIGCLVGLIGYGVATS